MERDFAANPYNDDEKRVVEYLAEIIPDVGGGDDPIGFLIASHRELVARRRPLNLDEKYARENPIVRRRKLIENPGTQAHGFIEITDGMLRQQVHIPFRTDRESINGEIVHLWVDGADHPTEITTARIVAAALVAMRRIEVQSFTVSPGLPSGFETHKLLKR